MTHDIVPAEVFDRSGPPAETGSGDRMIRLFLFTVFKRRRLILGSFLVFTLAAGIAVALQPPVRSATAKILLKLDRSALQVSGLVGISGRLPHSPQVLQSEVELIKSREVMRPVALRLLSDETNPGLTSAETQVELLSKDLTDRTLAVPLPETNVILVTHYARASQEAVKILRIVLDHYMEVHAAANSGSAKLLKFYVEEQERASTALRASEERLKKWREANGVVSIDAEIASQLPALAERVRVLQQTEAEMQSTRAKIASLKSQLAVQPERLMLSREHLRNPLLATLKGDLAAAEVPWDVERDPLLIKLKGELIGAEIALQELLQRYTDKDRRVQEKREQIDFLKRELASAEKEAQTMKQKRIVRLKEELVAAQTEGDIVGRETTALNPLREDLKRELGVAEALLPSLASRKEAVEKQLREASATVAALTAKKVHDDRLSRALAVDNDGFLFYAKKLEEARVAAGLEREQLATVSVIEQPHAGLDTGLMKRLLTVLLAAVVGLAFGLTVAFGLEFLNNSLRTQEDVEYYLGLPVLAAIPDLNHPRLALKS